MQIYDYVYKSLEGKEISMNEYEGKLILIVNTASKCGFTPQYEGLEELYKKYNEKDLVIIGFPCNQFQGQEPGNEEEIQKFCSIRYGVTFPLSEKIDVRGDSANPLYKYLISQKGFEGIGKGIKAKAFELMLKAKYGKSFNDNQIKWNFTKFLIDRKGNVVSRYESMVDPKEIANDIEKLL